MAVAEVRARMRAAADAVGMVAARANRRMLAVADSLAARVGLTPRTVTARPGWRVVARKEFGDNIGSIRFVILLFIIALACVAAVIVAAGNLRDAASAATETPSPFLYLFTWAPERLPSFVALIGFLGPLLGIAFGFDAINQERADGTLPRLVSQPIHRDDVVNGKFAAGLATIGITLVLLVAVTSGIGIVRMGITPSAGDVARLLAYLVVTLAYIGVWLAFAILCSVLLRRAATAALAAISAWIVLTLFGTFLAGLVADALGPDDQVGQLRLEYALTQVTPAGLYEASTGALLDPTVRTVGIVFAEQVDRAVASTLSLDQSLLVVWPQVTGLLAGCVVLFTVAYVAFLRQEIRA